MRVDQIPRLLSLLENLAMSRGLFVKPLVVPLFVTMLLVNAAQAEILPPIFNVKGVSPNRKAFDDAKRTTPIEIRSKDDAAKYFEPGDLKTLLAKVDFKKQFVLVFAWRGSGGDRLSYSVAESFPEQIFFAIQPGRTRDLRSHTAVYALRSNVKWSVK